METTFDQTFLEVDFTTTPLPSKNFEACTFLGCRFSGVNLSAYSFVECEFEDCDLSNIDGSQTAWQDCSFTRSKLMGIRFDKGNPFLFAIRLEKCNLQYSNFFGTQLKNSSFLDCVLSEVDFGQTQMEGIQMINCDFSRALWENTQLDKAVLSGAKDLDINPEANRLLGATLPKEAALRMLDKYNFNLE